MERRSHHLITQKQEVTKMITKFEKEIFDFLKENTRQIAQKRFITKDKIANLPISKKQYKKLFAILNCFSIEIVDHINYTKSKKAWNPDSTYQYGFTLPSQEETMLLLKKYRQFPSKERKQELIEKNKSLVYLANFQFSCKFKIPFEELLNYGYEGLLLAIDRFDPYKENNHYFFSYAYRVIYHQMLKEIAKEKAIPLTLLVEKLPFISSLAELDDFPISLDNQYPIPIDTFLEQEQFNKILNKILIKISQYPYRKEIICLYYGLLDYIPHNYTQIANKLGIPISRVSFLHGVTLCQIRLYIKDHKKERLFLKDFLASYHKKS